MRHGSLPKIDEVRSQFQSAEAYRYFLEDLTSDKLIHHLTFEE
ncbi:MULTISPECIES: hypothetical protein [unclassified Microcoleus]|nr:MULTISPECIES: hypothetical protein [unclassified Microcoleus]